LNGDKFLNDLADNTFPLCEKFMQFSKNDITLHAFDEQFNELIIAVTLHASLQKAMDSVKTLVDKETLDIN